ncbi:MAG: RNA methyltransferase [Rhizobiaceae bacterium]
MLHIIENADDPRIAPYKALRERDLVGREGSFIAEGKVVLTCLAKSNHFEAQSILLLENRVNGMQAVLDMFSPDVPVYVANQSIMDQIAGFHVHRGVLATGRPRLSRDTLKIMKGLPEDCLAVIMSNISNHDNVGAIFRNAAAFGANAVLLDEQCCNPLYRKAIRVSVGGVLTVPWAYGVSFEEIAGELDRLGFQFAALSPSGKSDISALPKTGRRALVLGSEGHGLPPAVMDRLQTYRIPINSNFDSLNVATASGIAMYMASSHAR